MENKYQILIVLHNGKIVGDTECNKDDVIRFFLNYIDDASCIDIKKED